MNLKLASAFSVFLFSSISSGQVAPGSATYKIRQIISDQNLVVAESTDANEVINPGKIFLVTFPNEKQCSLVLKEKKGSLLTLSSSSCSSAQEITKSLPIEASLIDQPIPEIVYQPVVAPTPSAPFPIEPKVEPKTLSRPLVGFFLHYSFADQLIFDEAYVSTSSGSGTVEAKFGTQNSLGFGVSFARMAPQDWGFLANIIYEPDRDMKSLTVSGPGGVYSSAITGLPPKASFIVFEGNVVRRWETFYMPFGFNYNIPTLSNLDGADLEYGGELGVFVGGGILLSEVASLEFFVRSIGMRLLMRNGTDTINFDSGSITGFGMGYKLWF